MENTEKKDAGLEPAEVRLTKLFLEDKALGAAFDKRVTKAIESYRVNHGIDGDNKPINFDEVQDLARREAELSLKSKALEIGIKKGMSPEIAVLLTGGDDKQTEKNINKVFSEITASYEKGRDSFIKENSYTPGGGSGMNIDYDKLKNSAYYKTVTKMYGAERIQQFAASEAKRRFS